MEMMMADGIDLKWEKVRRDEEELGRLRRAATELKPLSGGAFHVVTHPFGKIIVCRSATLLFFHVGDGGRPFASIEDQGLPRPLGGSVRVTPGDD